MHLLLAGLVKVLTFKSSKGVIMINKNFCLNNKLTWRNKARLNICIAKDLANSFGGKKADYLKRLNHNLKIKITTGNGFYSEPSRMAA